MYIKSIKIYGFGKHVNREFKFKKGLNVLYGDNEAGKSTLFAFIRAYRSRHFYSARFRFTGIFLEYSLLFLYKKIIEGQRVRTEKTRELHFAGLFCFL